MSERGLSRRDRILKRVLDITVSSVGLVAGAPLLLIGWVLATIDAGRNGFFTQVRIGRNGKAFRVLKLRTMRDLPGMETGVTTSKDPRITPMGRLLRRSKIDEIPQLVNVLLGHMSLVGPRPDVPGFADRLSGEDRIILTIRPGITGPATLQFRDEENLLSRQSDPERYNREVVFPQKVRLNREYIESYCLAKDLAILWRTLLPK